MKPNLAQLRRLVGNPDAYALQQLDGTYRPVREKLGNGILNAHLRGDITVGTYIGRNIRTEDEQHEAVARTLVFDSDVGDGSLDEVQAVREALRSLGVPTSSMGIEFSGKKGHHLWVLLANERWNGELRRVGRAALALAGLDMEVFPKQDELHDLGNLVKLPGGVHRVSGLSNNFVDRVPFPLPQSQWERVVAVLPPEVAARSSRQWESRFPCMEHIQEGVSEGGRNNQLFHLAAMLRRHGVSPENVRLVLRNTNEKCEPPLDDWELESLLNNEGGPICSQLPGNVQSACGENCLRARRQGLQVQPNQLRYAAEGETVVVKLAKEVGKTALIEHPDLDGTAKGRVRG